MDRALELAAHGAGAVSPNPLVGAVIVGPDGETWGEGWHGQYGGPHAEVWAVRDAERNGHSHQLDQATLIVTLEPCSHTGKTPPCADLILEHGIPRVIVAHEDPFPEVAGRGIKRLRQHGVEVTVGICSTEAKRLNEAFLTHVRTGRPLVTLKIAATLDGQIATASGDSQWVSGSESRQLVHRWRAETDAVLIGSGTARVDDPALTVRHIELATGQTQPLRVVLDRAGTLPSSLRLFTDDHAHRTVAVTEPGATPAYADSLRQLGGGIVSVPRAGDHLDLGAVLDRLGSGDGLPDGVRPVQSVLVEAGPGLATALLAQGLVDRVAWFVAPKLIGAGTPSMGSLGSQLMTDALGFVASSWETVGDDALLYGWRRAV